MAHKFPPLISLRAFEAAARHSSFKKAAEELCVTPSSISHQIQQLEGWLGVKLFNRLNRKVTLTTEGSTYYFTLSKAFEDIGAVTDLVSRRKAASSGKQRLKIITDAGFVECWLGPRLNDLQALMPEVQLEIASGEDIDDYLKGGADLAIHYGRGNWPEFKSEHLITGYEFPVCSPKLLSKSGALDLTKFPLLHEKNMAGWVNWLRHAGTTHPNVQDGPILHSTATIFDKVIAGEGIGLGDDIVAAKLLFSGDLVKPLEPVRKSDHSLYLLQISAEQDTEIAACVREWLIAELASHKKTTEPLRAEKAFSVSQN